MSHLRLAFDPPLATVTIARPERRNAMSEAMWRDLAPICEAIEARLDILAVVVEGAGGHFCAGADIGEFDVIFADADRARGYLGAIERGLEALSRIDRPTLAKVEGCAFGGGLALALACDLRFGVEDASFSIPPAKLGLIYGPVETRLLVETVGAPAARDLLFGARVVDSQEAARLGLIHRRLPATELEQTVRAQALAWSKLSRTSICGAKKAIRLTLETRSDAVRTLVEAAALGEDFREGRKAFSEKRAPRFQSASGLS